MIANNESNCLKEACGHIRANAGNEASTFFFSRLYAFLFATSSSRVPS